MKPLIIRGEGGEDIELRCTHEEEWPPAHTRLNETFESQRARGFITEMRYQQLQVWERVCGLKKMGPKCESCKLALHPVGDRLIPFAPDQAAPRQPYATRTKGLKGVKGIRRK
jgi:hypothetical protein